MCFGQCEGAQVDDLDVGERGIAIPAVIADLIGRPAFLASSSIDHHRQHCRLLHDGQNVDEIRCESVC